MRPGEVLGALLGPTRSLVVPRFVTMTSFTPTPTASLYSFPP